MRTKMVVAGVGFFSVFLLVCSAIAPAVFDQLTDLGIFQVPSEGAENDTGGEEIYSLRLVEFESDPVLYQRNFAKGIAGSLAINDGCAFLNLNAASQQLDPGCTILLSDYDENTGYPWLYVAVEFRLRCSDDNKLESDEGGGGRVWGLSDTITTCSSESWNTIEFWSCCPESDPEFAGFWTLVAVNGSMAFSQRLPGIDMREWHEYAIIWEERGATFLVDGDVVAFSPYVPDTPLAVRIQNVAQRFGSEGNTEYLEGFWGTPIQLENDQLIQVDYFHVFAYPEQIWDRSEAMADMLISAAELIEKADRRDMNTTKMWIDYSNANDQLVERRYVDTDLSLMIRSLVEHLDEVSNLFSRAAGALQTVEGEDIEAKTIRADYERAESAWGRYDYNATVDYLQRVLGAVG
jgi:hypothetical protein